MIAKPRTLVLNAPGINCNMETASAFEMAGAQVDQVHLSQLQSGERRLDQYDILALAGGFSYGDAIRSGAILGTELRTRFPEDINRFVEAGKAVIGICNGFQVLVESGLLPDGKIEPTQQKRVSLSHNANNKFECRWTKLVIEKSQSKFMDPADHGSVIELPVAHGEGRLVAVPEVDTAIDLFIHGQVALTYCNDQGMFADSDAYPDNPNGSAYGSTALTNEQGNILGMMPHPERFVSRHQHPDWRNKRDLQPAGAVLFKNIVEYSKEQ